MRLGFIAGLTLALIVSPTVVRADGPRFGGMGQLVISDDQPFGQIAASSLAPTTPSSISTASFQFATLSDNGGSGTAFAIAPALDFFAINELSLGGNVVFAVVSPAHGNSGPGFTETIFGIAPRVGYNVSITDTVSFWPKVYFGYVTASVDNNGGSANSTAIGVFAPFLFHPVPHFFIGIGPNLSTQLSNNVTPGVPGATSVSGPKVTQVGIEATFGGWVLGS